MKIGVWIFWHIVVDDDVHTLNVDTSAEDISCHHDSFLEVFELGVFLDSNEQWIKKSIHKK